MDNMMEQILENLDSLDNYKNLKQKLLDLSQEKITYFKEHIKSIKKQYMYKSNIHGIYHSEKVALNAYLIGLDQNLNDVDMEIILDAAIYHDIGRINDFEDSFHGMVSANKIDEVIDKDIYMDSNNLKILKAVMDFHSQNDKKIRINFENYEIDEKYYERYIKLAKILKDADALDRKRFVEQCNAALNPKFLRFDISHQLIELAKEINLLYYEQMEKLHVNVNGLESIKSDCLHSIGFDYFRIKSILNYGILSYKQMQMQQLSYPRNFDGGNSQKWISVVPTNLIDREGMAFSNFIKSGIVFLCDEQQLYKPLSYNQKAKAILKGLPYNKSNYIDELYAFLEIPREDIESIFVVNDFAYKDIQNITYLYNSLHFETLKDKIMYIFDNIKYTNMDNNNELLSLLEEYKKETRNYEYATYEVRRDLELSIFDKLNSLLIKINKIVSELIYGYYLIELNKKQGDKITTIDVIKYELDKENIKYNIISGEEEVVLLVNNKKRKKLTYNY